MKMRASARNQSMHNYLDFEKPISDLEGKILELRKLAGRGRERRHRRGNRAARNPGARCNGGDLFGRPQSLAENASCPPPCPPAFPGLCKGPCSTSSPRFGRRSQICRGRCHPGWLRQVPAASRLALIGQEKGHDTKTRIHHNFGSARPEGYRKAIRPYGTWLTGLGSRWSR
jgi:acetyl-CoA carboxylase carboxyl transferase subunit alpha